MKVALIVPPYPLEEYPAPPLGLCYAAAAFQDAGADVRIFDYLVRRYSPEKLHRELETYRPDVVGTNCVTLNFYQAAAILQTAKRYFPSIVTMMGGPHVSFDYHKTLKQYPELDLVVVGEGESTIAELTPVVRDRRRWETIRGLAFVENGEVRCTGRQEFIQNLDTLPTPARRLIPLSRYRALGFPVSIITSRGCPNQCTFCQGRRMVGAKVRYRGIDKIVDEIEQVIALGFNRVNIADDFFTSNRDRVELLCDEILKRNLRFGWSAFARVDSVDAELMECMLAAGCDSISFGIEAGNPEMLKRIRKRISLGQARRAASDCRKVGMKAFASFIVGLPGESYDTLMETHRFALELNIPFGYHFLAPFPGTTLYEQMDQFDLELVTRDYSRFDANQAIVRTSRLSPEDMERFVDEHYFSYIRLKEEETARVFREGRCPEDEQRDYIGKQKNDIIFQLLSRDIIETHGSFSAVSEGNHSRQQLISAVTEVLGRDPAIVNEVVGDNIASGNLTSRRADGEISWFWA